MQNNDEKKFLITDPKELKQHRDGCASIKSKLSIDCNCDFYIPRQMTMDEARELDAYLAKLIKDDPWLGFERKGIQTEIYEAWNRHKNEMVSVFIQGPNQIRKSTANHELLKDALKRENKYRQWANRPLHIQVLCPKQSQQHSGFQREFIKWNAEWLKKSMNGKPALKGQSKAWAGVDFINGDHLQFDTFDAGVEYIESVTADLVIMEEGPEFYEFYEYLLFRLQYKKGALSWSFIPPPPYYELYKKIIEPARRGIKEDDIEVIFGGAKHFIDIYGRELYEKYKRRLSPKIFAIKVEGLNIGSGRMVYAFDTVAHCIPPSTRCKYNDKVYDLADGIPEDWRRDITIDWANTDNPPNIDPAHKRKTVAIFIAIAPPGTEIILPNNQTVISTQLEPVHVIYNGYECEKRKIAIQHAKSIIDLWETRGNWTEKFQSIMIDAATGVKDATVDRSAFEDFRLEFQKAGNPYTYPATNKKKKSKDEKELIGHNLVDTVIHQNRLLVLQAEKTQFIIDAFGRYEMNDKTNEPQTFGDDEMDAIRYYINIQPTYINPFGLDPYIIKDEVDVIIKEIALKKLYADPEFEYFNKLTRR